MLCELKELELFSSEEMKFGDCELSPRAMMLKIFEGKFASKGPDVCIMRLKAYESVNRPGARGLLGVRLKGRVVSLTMVDHYDPKTDMSAMMRTTAFPASIGVQMLASGAISKWVAYCRRSMFQRTCSSVKSRTGDITIDYAIE